MAVHLLSSAAASPDFLQHLMQSNKRSHRCSKQPQNPSDFHSMFRLAVYFSESIIFFFSRTAMQLIYSNIFIISIFPKLFIQQRLSIMFHLLLSPHPNYLQGKTLVIAMPLHARGYYLTNYQQYGSHTAIRPQVTQLQNRFLGSAFQGFSQSQLAQHGVPTRQNLYHYRQEIFMGQEIGQYKKRYLNR